MEIFDDSNAKNNQFVNKEIGKINKRLNKEEILRGHLVFSNILRNSVLIRTDCLKVFIDHGNKSSQQTHTKDFNVSPLLTNYVKVGFIIAKKKIRKAYARNRIKRLMKEAYRLNKHLLKTPDNLNILFALNDKGYEIFKKDKKIKLDFMQSELNKVLEKINKYFTEK